MHLADCRSFQLESDNAGLCTGPAGLKRRMEKIKTPRAAVVLYEIFMCQASETVQCDIKRECQCTRGRISMATRDLGCSSKTS